MAIALDHVLQPQPKPIGWIGVHLQSMTPELALALKVPQRGIAVITQVDSPSPASEAGLQSGDVILSFAGQQPADSGVLMGTIANTPVGTTQALEVWSAGKVKTLVLPIQGWPHILADWRPPNAACQSQAEPDLGVLLEPITPADRQRYDLGDTSGLLVAAVVPTSEAYSLGFRPGIVVEKIDDEPVTTRAQVRAVLRDAAQHGSVVALLVQWANGPSWFTLHIGQAQEKGGSPGTPDSNAFCTQDASP